MYVYINMLVYMRKKFNTYFKSFIFHNSQDKTNSIFCKQIIRLK